LKLNLLHPQIISSLIKEVSCKEVHYTKLPHTAIQIKSCLNVTLNF